MGMAVMGLVVMAVALLLALIVVMVLAGNSNSLWQKSLAFKILILCIHFVLANILFVIVISVP